VEAAERVCNPFNGARGYPTDPQGGFISALMPRCGNRAVNWVQSRPHRVEWHSIKTPLRSLNSIMRRASMHESIIDWFIRTGINRRARPQGKTGQVTSADVAPSCFVTPKDSIYQLWAER